MPDRIIQLNTKVIKKQLKKLVWGSADKHRQNNYSVFNLHSLHT